MMKNRISMVDQEQESIDGWTYQGAVRALLYAGFEHRADVDQYVYALEGFDPIVISTEAVGAFPHRIGDLALEVIYQKSHGDVGDIVNKLEAEECSPDAG
jgi:hypothetical protein